jgi:hypothetical protein
VLHSCVGGKPIRLALLKAGSELAPRAEVGICRKLVVTCPLRAICRSDDGQTCATSAKAAPGRDGQRRAPESRVWQGAIIEVFVQDLRYALRQLRCLPDLFCLPDLGNRAPTLPFKSECCLHELDHPIYGVLI